MKGRIKMKTFTYKITDEQGIHARPAGMLIKEAKKYQSKIIVSADEKEAEATKLIGIMSMGIKCGTEITVTIEGEDEELAVTNMQSFFKQYL